MNPNLLLAFYGDDFTGSTDALESLASAGIRTMLFLAPPTAAQLQRFPNLQAIGVAGLTRSLAPEPIQATLKAAFAALRELNPRHIHYKVCSTFDSSPTVGSIGCAIDVGAKTFAARVVPLLVAAPALGRYCAFGNLFARFGIGSSGAIHRLDRHPAISRHPVTPMTEADLRVHLAKQTAKPVGLVDVLALEGSDADLRAAFDTAIADGAEVMLFDALRREHLPRIGALIDAQAPDGGPVFSVGSSGVTSALAAHWTAQRLITPHDSWPAANPAQQPLLVLSGSCSPVTHGQIEWALARDFHGIAWQPAETDSVAVAAEAMLASLRAGRPTVVFTSRSSNDHATSPISSEMIGAGLGQLARAAVEQLQLRRVLFCGGDTSSYAARALGIEAVEMIAPLTPGAPLCRVHASSSSRIDGLEVCFKGGQVGAEDFFGRVAEGNREN